MPLPNYSARPTVARTNSESSGSSRNKQFAAIQKNTQKLDRKSNSNSDLMGKKAAEKKQRSKNSNEEDIMPSMRLPEPMPSLRGLQLPSYIEEESSSDLKGSSRSFSTHPNK